jgi:Type VI secretion system/phage-baseplate injector OB domain
MSAASKFYGKYRGTVVNNVDPMMIGRVQVQCAEVLGLGISSWAMPCVPVAGKHSGSFFMPELGAGVWVEFEHGDADYPIWTGCFWGLPAELPEMGLASPPPTPNIVLQTIGQNSLTVMGAPGAGITICSGPIASPTSPRIMITQAGIIITNGVATITVAGPVVDINNGALTVT